MMKYLALFLFLLSYSSSTLLAQKVYKNKIVYADDTDTTIIDAKHIRLKGDTVISITEDRYGGFCPLPTRFMPYGWVNGKVLTIKEKYWQRFIPDSPSEALLGSPDAALKAFEKFNDYDESAEDAGHIHHTFIMGHAARIRAAEAKKAKPKPR